MGWCMLKAFPTWSVLQGSKTIWMEEAGLPLEWETEPVHSMMIVDDTSYTSNLEEGFAVLPFRISILPDTKVSAVHLGDKNNDTICQVFGSPER